MPSPAATTHCLHRSQSRLAPIWHKPPYKELRKSDYHKAAAVMMECKGGQAALVPGWCHCCMTVSQWRVFWPSPKHTLCPALSHHLSVFVNSHSPRSTVHVQEEACQLPLPHTPQLTFCKRICWDLRRRTRPTTKRYWFSSFPFLFSRKLAPLEACSCYSFRWETCYCGTHLCWADTHCDVCTESAATGSAGHQKTLPRAHLLLLTKSISFPVSHATGKPSMSSHHRSFCSK